MTRPKFDQRDLVAKLHSHAAWLSDKPEGKQLLILDSDLSDISLTQANFENAVLARCVITNATFVECNLRRVGFFDTVFRDCVFHNCNMWKVRLNGADFADVDFTGSKLAKAELNRARGERANFTNCDLGYAYISADLRNANFENVSFVWTHFGGAKLYNTRKFHIRSFDKATVLGDPADVSPEGDGSILLTTVDELIAYLGLGPGL